MMKEWKDATDPRRLAGILDKALARAYPDVVCPLDFEDPFECLVATILSAQCTDRKVNEATPTLFRRFPGVDAFAEANPGEIEPLIRSLGLFRRKAADIAAAARLVRERYGGRVPDTIEELIELPGVGRKTANCVILNAYGKPGLMCDTHFCRVSRRFGLHDLADPDRIEATIAVLLPSSRWGVFSHRIIQHGRLVCQARNPSCETCPASRHCRSRRGKAKRPPEP
ncbi:MAG: endonuclease III [Planctomycetota bacterium]|jgi:endonuclease-3|nr:endonuclease III [Planctomycetota bacterium]